MIKKYMWVALLVLAGAGCRKTDFATINDPAYLRVFNCLETKLSLDNKDVPQSFLTMLIDPVLDKDGIATSAAITGDFLQTRDPWARPYPDAANTTLYQSEYPGTAKVMAAPILNGYDLSSWAQVPSGQHRIIFLSRPLNSIPFFSLDKGQRNYKLIDTSVSLASHEVYTMNVLEKDYRTRQTILYMRTESFHKQPLSDSLVYCNFYNLSSNGYFELAPKDFSTGNSFKLVDSANVYCTLRKAPTDNVFSVDIPGFVNMPMGEIIRSQDPKVMKYYSFPLVADTSSNRIFPGNTAQMINFMKKGYPVGTAAQPWAMDLPEGYYLGVTIGPFGRLTGLDHAVSVMADIRSGLIVTERSGIYNPRYFATVNTIEYINAKVYITTIQRKLDPPIY